MTCIYSSEPIFTCIWYLLCAIFGTLQKLNLIEDVEWTFLDHVGLPTRFPRKQMKHLISIPAQWGLYLQCFVTKTEKSILVVTWKRCCVWHSQQRQFTRKCCSVQSAQMRREILQTMKTGWLTVHNTAITQILAVWAPGSDIQFSHLQYIFCEYLYTVVVNWDWDHIGGRQNDKVSELKFNMINEKHEQCICLPKTNLGIFGESSHCMLSCYGKQQHVVWLLGHL